MEKLELKHIVGYLPYGLKVLSGFGEYSEIDSLYFSKDGHKRPSLNLMVSHFPKGFRGENFEDIKPLLRPLSDLTKEIEVNGEKFVPIRRLYDMRHVSDSELRLWLNEMIKDIKNNQPFKLSEFEKLYEWHFDIHELIEKNLAIDINTLDNGIQ